MKRVFTSFVVVVLLFSYSFLSVFEVNAINSDMLLDSQGTAVSETVVSTVGMPTVLTVPALRLIPEGSDFDKMRSLDNNDVVTAIDTEDGDITSQITVTDTVDSNVYGVYKHVFSVQDSDGNVTIATQVVVVYNANYMSIGQDVILVAKDFDYIDQSSDTLTQSDALVMAGEPLVYDKMTGDIVSHHVVGLIEPSSSTANVKLYLESDPTVAVIVTFEQVASTFLYGDKLVYVNKGEVFNPLEHVTASDVILGDISNALITQGSVDTSIVGFYPFDYSYTDSAQNIHTHHALVLVKDETVHVGFETVVIANDFSIMPQDVNLDDAAITLKANYKTYSKSDGQVMPLVPEIDKGTYSSKDGIYTIQFLSPNDQWTSLSIDATVGTRTISSLSVPYTTEVLIGEVHDPMAGVTFLDAKDETFVADIMFEGAVDTNTIGVYAVHYSVVDSSNETLNATQIVVVKDDSVVIGQKTVIIANDFTMLDNKEDTSFERMLNGATVRVYDLNDARLLDNVVVSTRVGEMDDTTKSYTVSFEVLDDPTASIDVVASTTIGRVPVITVPAFTQVDVGGVFNPMSGMSAIDPEQGIMTNQVVLTGDYDLNRAGVYVLAYSIEDSDLNSVTEKQVIVVSDKSVVIGDNNVIIANDFTRFMNDVNVSQAAILHDANVRIYDKVSGALLESGAMLKHSGGYTDIVGSYTIKIGVVSDPGATVNITASVLFGEAPTLKVPKITDVALNGVFDPMTGVSAIDREQGNITKDIVVTGAYDLSISGVYTLDYTICDSDGHTAMDRQVLVVSDHTVAIGSSTIIKANDFTKLINDVDVQDTAIIQDANVTVYDKVTGAIIEDAPVLVNNGRYSANESTYLVTFKVDYDPKAHATVQAYVSKGDAPVLTVPKFTQIDLGSDFDERSEVSAIDPEQGDITYNVVIKGSADLSSVGVYSLLYTITDKDGNMSNCRRLVVVKDDSVVIGETVIIVANDFTKDAYDVNTSDLVILDDARVSVYDIKNGVCRDQDIVLVDNGGYQAVGGDYAIVFEVVSDPKATISVNAHVNATDETVLTVPTFTELAVNDIFDPMLNVTAIDPVQGDVTDNVELSGTVDTNTVGVYVIDYIVAGTEQNSITAKQVVVVADETLTISDTRIVVVNDFSKDINEVDVTEATILNDANVHVYDKDSGAIVENDVYVLNNGGYTNVVGTYMIEFGLVSETETGVSVTANVIANESYILTELEYQ